MHLPGLSEAIKYAQEGRASHHKWLAHLEASCDCCSDAIIEAVGDADVQREWIRKYDVILAALGRAALRAAVEATP